MGPLPDTARVLAKGSNSMRSTRTFHSGDAESAASTPNGFIEARPVVHPERANFHH